MIDINMEIVKIMSDLKVFHNLPEPWSLAVQGD